MADKKAFVTGATGLLGGNLCRELLAGGWAVSGLARSAPKARDLLGDTDVRIVTGDMGDVEGFVAALDDCDVLFHTAAYFREYYQPGDHWEPMRKVNVEATMELLGAAEARGVERTVFTSSSGVIEFRGGGVPNESAPYSAAARDNLYFKTKVLAEQRIYRFLEHSRMPVVMILPGWMMGPGDAAPTNAGQLILDLLAGRLPGIIDGGASLVDARDVARAMVVAAERGTRGGRYIVAGELATLETIAATLAQVAGSQQPRVLPTWLALTAARVSEVVAKVTGGVSRMPVDGIKLLREKVALSSHKAMAELGVEFRPLRSTIENTVAWYRTRGYLDQRNPHVGRDRER